MKLLRRVQAPARPTCPSGQAIAARPASAVGDRETTVPTWSPPGSRVPADPG